MKHQTQDIPVVLTIAGSDSSGGAGIQADIKTISATGSYACSVITAVTAQNTQGVDAVHPLPADIVGQQLDSVLNDLNVVAVKIGMLSQPDIIEVIAEKLSIFQPRWLVIDPVMISTSGTHLLEPSATGILKNILLPMADLITPNLPEALMLTSHAESDCLPAMPLLTEQLRKIHPKGILLKGGHSEDKNFCEDLLITPDEQFSFKSERITTSNTHGTGCTLSSAIASFLAQGNTLYDAVALAKTFISAAISNADRLCVGQGKGPVHHFHAFYQSLSGPGTKR
ncbi:bifunctional hydroxymethylpyrimidine kinase/phosphomethylpyrimidine kinase [Vibrio quintilis]|uniref:hydroxymethylpyrimidine kinase n=1 Tax=Vibrio quintilis TaxID=1117707 RepID=A0A1M7YQT7_9VIBR|nr:bifunctional hydroxymethylpyrimidine kinase/phosphomethylpyrimidine kinase [Vibrio quintilis]SHO54969.1 Hydroxymethylpyrimidine/phosphomethylpyrimidine kinase [Vibrio quintilis]